MNRKIITMGVLALFLLAGAMTAQAWQVEVTNVEGDLTLGQYYWQEIYFYSDTGDDNLNKFFLTLDYDESKVELVGVLYDDYDDGDPFFPETIWNGGLLPHTDNGNQLYNLNGTETLGNSGIFLPSVGDTQLVRIAWNPLVAEDDVTVATWGDADASDFVQVDDVQYWMPTDFRNIDDDPLLAVTYNETENRAILAPVPIPAAVWLLGSGLLGIVGLRRRIHR